MSKKLPFVNSTGALKRLLESIIKAKTPGKFNYDYMKGEHGVTERSILALLRKLEFLDSSGTPTQRYKDFRNPDSSKTAMGKAMEIAFKPLYDRNEYVHLAKRDELKKLVSSITGLDHDSKAVKSTIGTYNALLTFASFDYKNLQDDEQENFTDDQSTTSDIDTAESLPISNSAKSHPPQQSLGLNLGYTINLILPETTNIQVFNAIFKSLNENLLRKQ